LKVEIEIPDEDIEQLEVFLKKNPQFGVSFKNLRRDLKTIMECIGKQSVKSFYEALLAMKSGVIASDDFLSTMFLEGAKMGSKIRLEDDKTED